MALVGDRCDYAGLGVDLARVAAVPSDAELDVVCVADEREWVTGDARKTAVRFALAFAAKEAVYKALAPNGCPPLAFPDVALRWVDSRSAFHPAVAAGRRRTRLDIDVRCWWGDGVAIAATHVQEIACREVMLSDLS